MKKLAAALCLAGCLGLAAPAVSAVQTFGPGYYRFSIDVPEGWTTAPQDGGCQLVSPDEKSSFSVQVLKNNGKSASELAKAIGKEVGGKILLAKDLGPDQSILEIELDGVRLKIVVNVDGDKFCAVIMAGPDEEAMLKIMNSITWRREAAAPLPRCA